MLVELERELKRKEQEVVKLKAKIADRDEKHKVVEADSENQVSKFKQVVELAEEERDQEKVRVQELETRLKEVHEEIERVKK